MLRLYALFRIAVPHMVSALIAAALFIAAFIAALPVGMAAPARADMVSTTLSGADVAAALQAALGATSVHLHSLGALTGDSYYAANAASIKVPASVSGVPGQRTYFSLPDTSSIVLGRRYGYYVNHLRSSSLSVAANPDSFTISLTLNAAGPALVGTCVRLSTPPRACATGSDDATPSIEWLPAIDWRDARIDIIAKPVVQSRSLALDVQSVIIGGTFDPGRTCEWPLIGVRLCAALNRHSQRLRQQIATRIKDALNTDDVRRNVAAAVRIYFDTTLNEPLLGVRHVTMQDGRLRIGLDFGR